MSDEKPVALTVPLDGSPIVVGKNDNVLHENEERIVKVQIPIHEDSRGKRIIVPGPCLVYAKGRVGVKEMTPPNWVLSALRSHVPVGKAYFRATWEDGGWFILNQEADQDW